MTNKKQTTTTTPRVLEPDTDEYNITHAPAIKAARIAEFHKALADGSLGSILPEKYAPGIFVLGDGTIVERK